MSMQIQQYYLNAMGIQTWALREKINSPEDKAGWKSLKSEAMSCQACPLCEGRTQVVFGVGDQNADLLLVGEAPGANEDRQGEPFVGRAGQLLNRMLKAIGLQRDEIYIANVLKCRPP